ncbi:MAG: hypothetical protein WBP61_07125 [Nocardioides sp.]
MRHGLTRFAGLVAAAALLIVPVTAAGPAQAAEDPTGTVTVNFVDDQGRPVTALLGALYTAGGQVELLEGRASSITQEVPVGRYGILVMGGWGGLSCGGIAPCSLGAFAEEGALPRVTAPVITVTEGGQTTYTLESATPKLVGTGKVGSPLKVRVPTRLTELGEYFASVGGPVYAGLSIEPSVSWLRNGTRIGETGLTYRPTAQDSGRKIAARLTFPPLLTAIYAQAGGSPDPMTTTPVKIGKVKPKLSLNLSKRVKQGTRPVAYVTVKLGRAAVRGVVALKVAKHPAMRQGLRSGFAAFKLPKLAPGTYKVKAEFLGQGAYKKVAKTTRITVTR